MTDPTHATGLHRRGAVTAPVDWTDWLKSAALICAVLDHVGHFFMDDDRWWAVVGRLAAPTFFFLVGYAHTRTVPFRWVWLGIGLTLLESMNADWTFVHANVLLSLALVRVARPHIQTVLERYGWVGFAILVAVLVAAQPAAGEIVDYGAEGWLWALFGVCQRLFVDTSPDRNAASGGPAAPAGSFAFNPSLMRVAACMVAVAIYLHQENAEFAFGRFQLTVFIAAIVGLSTCLCRFRRGPSLYQPPQVWARPLRFVGRHTLEIYAVQLAGSELIVDLWPDLGP